MGTFGMATDMVHKGGVNIQNQADEFGYARKKIKDTIDFLLQAYPSSDGVDIARNIEAYEPTLNAMQAKLQAHGDYGVYASKTTVATNEDIRSNIAKNI